MRINYQLMTVLTSQLEDPTQRVVISPIKQVEFYTQGEVLKALNSQGALHSIFMESFHEAGISPYNGNESIRNLYRRLTRKWSLTLYLIPYRNHISEDTSNDWPSSTPVAEPIDIQEALDIISPPISFEKLRDFRDDLIQKITQQLDNFTAFSSQLGIYPVSIEQGCESYVTFEYPRQLTHKEQSALGLSAANPGADNLDYDLYLGGPQNR